MEYVKTFKELREELEKKAPPAVLEEFDRHVSNDEKVHAFQILREYEINPVQ